MEPKPTKSREQSSSEDVKIPALPPPSSSNDAAVSEAAASRPYIYRDFAQDDTDYGGEAEISVADGRGLTNQKLPAKLNAMLSDPGEC